MREEIKKQKSDKQKTEASEANMKTFIWLFVLEWYPLGVKESLDQAPEQVSCKCLHQYSRIVEL